jgi:hypothetical protein
MIMNKQDKSVNYSACCYSINLLKMLKMMNLLSCNEYEKIVTSVKEHYDFSL